MIPIIVAILAPLINIIQQIPQLYKTYITKSVNDLSLGSLILFLFTNILWSLHGFFIGDLSCLIGSLISMFITLSLLILFLLYDV